MPFRSTEPKAFVNSKEKALFTLKEHGLYICMSEICEFTVYITMTKKIESSEGDNSKMIRNNDKLETFSRTWW